MPLSRGPSSKPELPYVGELQSMAIRVALDLDDADAHLSEPVDHQALQVLKYLRYHFMIMRVYPTEATLIRARARRIETRRAAKGAKRHAPVPRAVETFTPG